MGIHCDIFGTVDLDLGSREKGKRSLDKHCQELQGLVVDEYIRPPKIHYTVVYVPKYSSPPVCVSGLS